MLIAISLLIALLVMGLGLPALILARYSRPSLIPVLTGAALLALTLIIQPPIQRLPRDVITGFAGQLPYILYAALASGFLQEGLKLMALTRYRDSLKASWLGYGFGAGEALLVTLNFVVTALAGLPYNTVFVIVGAYERFITTLYHSASAVILSSSRWGTLPKYVGLSLIHSLMNFSAGVAIRYFNLFGSAITMAALYGALTAVVLPLLAISLGVMADWRRAGTSVMG